MVITGNEWKRSLQFQRNLNSKFSVCQLMKLPEMKERQADGDGTVRVKAARFNCGYMFLVLWSTGILQHGAVIRDLIMWKWIALSDVLAAVCARSVLIFSSPLP